MLQTAPTPPRMAARTWAFEKGDGGALGEGGVLGSMEAIDKVAKLEPLDAQVHGAVVGGASIDPASARSSANGPGAARSAVVAPHWRTRPACSVRLRMHSEAIRGNQR